ncbi:serine/threonine-protein kinase [Natronoglycomyces albus]|uniref:non-specific serine/threonine protein kinase n=1 Tax=Natronoglycomyces albus TaxID=2811108 RepID=A0A895XQ75_9ACTN|nr:serine/threonine-protein kinase [Natronoglycomyces albus]QSB05693.1 serine/threonine protein kinase [Natronoglycomyces albus]
MSEKSVIASRYALLTTISTGGMGQVWKGRDLRLDRDIAVKLIRSDLLGRASESDGIIARFRREAQVTARVRHDGVPAIYDADFDAEAAQLYLVMEYIPGLNLDDAIAESSPLPWAQVIAIGAQIAAVLQQAHDTPVIHRDLKPANILIDTNGQVKVVDFGIAAVVETHQTRLTHTGDRVGTDHYMAPEQINGETVGPYTDLYALGCLLFELATGRRVFDSHTQYAVLHAHATQRPPSLPSVRPDAPDELSDLVASLLAKDPVHRPASAAQVYSTLYRLLVPLLSTEATESLGDAGDPTWPFRLPCAPIAVLRAQGPASCDVTEVVSGRVAEAERRFEQGDMAGALTLFRALGKELRGVDLGAALNARSRAAECLAAMGHTQAAISGLTAVTDEQQRLWGHEHLTVLRTRLNLARLRRSLGAHGHSDQELRGLVDDMASALGATHPETVAAQQLLGTWGEDVSTRLGEASRRWRGGHIEEWEFTAAR